MRRIGLMIVLMMILAGSAIAQDVPPWKQACNDAQALIRSGDMLGGYNVLIEKSALFEGIDPLEYAQYHLKIAKYARGAMAHDKAVVAGRAAVALFRAMPIDQYKYLVDRDLCLSYSLVCEELGWGQKKHIAAADTWLEYRTLISSDAYADRKVASNYATHLARAFYREAVECNKAKAYDRAIQVATEGAAVDATEATYCWRTVARAQLAKGDTVAAKAAYKKMLGMLSTTMARHEAFAIREIKGLVDEAADYLRGNTDFAVYARAYLSSLELPTINADLMDALVPPRSAMRLVYQDPTIIIESFPLRDGIAVAKQLNEGGDARPFTASTNLGTITGPCAIYFNLLTSGKFVDAAKYADGEVKKIKVGDKIGYKAWAEACAGALRANAQEINGDALAYLDWAAKKSEVNPVERM